MKIWILLIIMAGVLGYMRGYADGPIQTREQIIKEIDIQTVINGTTCVNYTNVVLQREMIKYNVQNRTISLSEAQTKQIYNMRPSDCEGTGCSFGYILAKYDCMDILKMELPKFSERPSINYNPQFENIEYIPIKEDDFGKYIRLNGSWMLFSTNGIHLKQELCDNYSFSNTSRWSRIDSSGELYLREV